MQTQHGYKERKEAGETQELFFHFREDVIRIEVEGALQTMRNEKGGEEHSIATELPYIARYLGIIQGGIAHWENTDRVRKKQFVSRQ